MRNGSYLMDTHVLDWFLFPDERLSENVREDIFAYPHKYCVSVLSLLELQHLQQVGKKKVVFSMKVILERISQSSITVLPLSKLDISELENIPILMINKQKHTDPFDRALIAICKKYGMTMVSCDQKFPAYQKDKTVNLDLWYFGRN